MDGGCELMANRRKYLLSLQILSLQSEAKDRPEGAIASVRMIKDRLLLLLLLMNSLSG